MLLNRLLIAAEDALSNLLPVNGDVSWGFNAQPHLVPADLDYDHGNRFSDHDFFLFLPAKYKHKLSLKNLPREAPPCHQEATTYCVPSGIKVDAITLWVMEVLVKHPRKCPRRLRLPDESVHRGALPAVVVEQLSSFPAS